MSAAHTKASELVQTVYRSHLEHFGDPDRAIRFGNGIVREGEEHFPPVMDVMIWRPDDSTDIATLSAIGMSDRPMANVAHRAELHFSLRRRYLSEDEEYQASQFLANLATYPFHYGTSLDWWWHDPIDASG